MYHIHGNIETVYLKTDTDIIAHRYLNIQYSYSPIVGI